MTANNLALLHRRASKQNWELKSLKLEVRCAKCDKPVSPGRWRSSTELLPEIRRHAHSSGAMHTTLVPCTQLRELGAQLRELREFCPTWHTEVSQHCCCCPTLLVWQKLRDNWVIWRSVASNQTDTLSWTLISKVVSKNMFALVGAS